MVAIEISDRVTHMSRTVFAFPSQISIIISSFVLQLSEHHQLVLSSFINFALTYSICNKIPQNRENPTISKVHLHYLYNYSSAQAHGA